MRGWRQWLKRSLVVGLGLFAAGIAFIAWANFAATRVGRGCLFDDPSEVPGGGIGLVFGCDPWVQGRENLYFRYRIDAAEALWKAGKLRGLIVSGDNRSRHYNEPDKMRRALVARGVPADRIVCDYAGLRTLDSVVRAKEIFGVERITFISQRFQNERAAFLARASGMESAGFNARDVAGQGGFKTKLREIGARVKMWLDVHVLATRPRHLGERIELPDWK
ncbi:MAG: vancomycin high temperature exclusion protein [Verrucomicrobia bacterium]|nr:MAG: vancomycin high temperature exclusion protein [Verrucomicrobiota bacterium]TAF41204.1 MAG: vancomycin high temperature exclusion protein [Verrucomicrobiota bacterium]